MLSTICLTKVTMAEITRISMNLRIDNPRKIYSKRKESNSLDLMGFMARLD